MIRPSDDDIRLRAYQLFLERDGVAGDPQEDWLRAESELMAPSMSALPAAVPKAPSKKAVGRRAES